MIIMITIIIAIIVVITITIMITVAAAPVGAGRRPEAAGEEHARAILGKGIVCSVYYSMCY